MSVPTIQLKDVCAFVSGGTPSKEINIYYEGDIPWITSADINGAFVSNARSYITDEAIKKSATKLVKKGTVLFVTRTGVGKVAIAGMDLCFSQDITAVIPDESKLDKYYLMYFLRSKKNHFSYFQRGATIKGITREIIERLLIPLPSLETQRKIADLLDNIQRFIALRKEQIEKWDEFVKGVFLEMFGDPIKNEKGWTTNSIMNCVKPVKKKNMKNYPNKKLRYIDISSIDNVRNKITGYIEHTGETAPSRAQQIVNYGDILISTVRPNLKNVALIEYDYDNLIASTGFCVLRTNESINNWFLFQLVKLDSFTNILIKITTGANYPAVKNSDIYNQHIILPPFDLQNKFAALVEKTEKQKELMEESLSAMETLFNGIAQKAFRGELFN